MNIEKTISEQAVSDILTPMLESQDRIVTEDVAPLFDQATGLDTPPASGSVTTTIEESRSVITAIIRKAWKATLTMLGGASVISYIAAAYTYLRNRLQGDETYGIPDRRSEISASSPLAANLALLNDRKIGGAIGMPDGLSIVRLLCSDATYPEVTEIVDDNTGYTINMSRLKSLIDMFPNLVSATITGDGQIVAQVVGNVWVGTVYNRQKLVTLNIPNITSANVGAAGTDDSGMVACINNNPLLETIYAPKVDVCNIYGNGNKFSAFIANNPSLKKVWLGKVVNSNTASNTGWGGTKWIIQRCEALEELHVPNVVNVNYLVRSGQNANLILLEFTAEQANSANLAWWNPTNVLADQDLLQQFLSNFRSYIANRLKGGYPIGQGPILTLSQAVRNAIHAAEATYGIENIIITQKGWTISPAPN